MKVIPVIMAGGAGTRLWPLSRDEKPKQFHNLSGQGTLMEGTLKRLIPLQPEEILIVTSRKYEELSKHELERFSVPGAVLSEPRPRNTAAAILYAALYLDSINSDSVMVVLPADHHIRDTAEFVRILKEAVKQAGHDSLVTIGIEPAYPETGYGYIKAVDGSAGPAREIECFVEKPDIERARRYVESGSYFWNSGIFIWKTSVILNQFRNHMPELVSAFKPLAEMDADGIASNSNTSWAIKESIFNSIEPVSIDYGILEKADSRVVIPADFGWFDLGSWKSIDDILEPDAQGNRAPDRDRAIFLDSENCSVFSENSRVSVIGLSNVVVVQAGGEILVIDKDSSQEVKKVAEMAQGKY